jgi:WD40 repeat protein
VQSGELLGQPIVHNDYVMWIAFDPTGSWLATVGANGSVRLAQLFNGVQYDLTPSHESSNYRVAFSPDGRRMLTSSSDRTARLWDVQSRHLINKLTVTGDGYFASFSRDGRFVLTSGPPRVWDGETGDPIGPPVQHEGVVMARFSPSADRIATASWDKTVRVWDRETLQQIGKSMLHPSPVRLVEWSESGRLVATVDAHSTVRIWDAAYGELLETPVQHTQDIVFLAFGFNNTLLTASWDGTARITDIAGIDVDPWNIPQASAATFTPDGSALVTGSADGVITLWDVRSRKPSGATMVQDGASICGICRPRLVSADA